MNDDLKTVTNINIININNQNYTQFENKTDNNLT